MNDQIKLKIIELRNAGQGYKKIASTLNISLNSVKSFIRRNKNNDEITTDTCKNCGAIILQVNKHKTKRFCSDSCRTSWWSKNRYSLSNTKMITITCKCCGKEFKDYPNQNRKYCSEKCYLKSRFGGEYDE